MGVAERPPGRGQGVLAPQPSSRVLDDLGGADRPAVHRRQRLRCLDDGGDAGGVAHVDVSDREVRRRGVLHRPLESERDRRRDEQHHRHERHEPVAAHGGEQRRSGVRRWCAGRWLPSRTSAWDDAGGASDEAARGRSSRRRRSVANVPAPHGGRRRGRDRRDALHAAQAVFLRRSPRQRHRSPLHARVAPRQRATVPDQ